MLKKADLVAAVRALKVTDYDSAGEIVDVVLKTMLAKTPSGWMKANVRQIMEPRDETE